MVTTTTIAGAASAACSSPAENSPWAQLVHRKSVLLRLRCARRGPVLAQANSSGDKLESCRLTLLSRDLPRLDQTYT